MCLAAYFYASVTWNGGRACKISASASIESARTAAQGMRHARCSDALAWGLGSDWGAVATSIGHHAGKRRITANERGWTTASDFLLNARMCGIGNEADGDGDALRVVEKKALDLRVLGA